MGEGCNYKNMGEVGKTKVSQLNGGKQMVKENEALGFIYIYI